MKSAENRFYVFLFALGCLLYSCDNQTGKENSEEKTDTGSLVSYYPGTKKIKSRMAVVNGEKHGLATLYYYSGGKQLEITYVNGSKEGVSTKYYESGEKYSETTYENDKMNGTRTTFYTSGRIKAKSEYRDNLLAVNTVVYNRKGKAAPPRQIKVSKRDDGLYNISYTGTCKRSTYYEGFLVDGKFFDEKKLVPIAMNNKKTIAIWKPGANQDKANFICKCINAAGSTLIFQKSVRL